MSVRTANLLELIKRVHQSDLDRTSAAGTHNSFNDTTLTCFQCGAPNRYFTSEIRRDTIPLWVECGAWRPGHVGLWQTEEQVPDTPHGNLANWGQQALYTWHTYLSILYLSHERHNLVTLCMYVALVYTSFKVSHLLEGSLGKTLIPELFLEVELAPLMTAADICMSMRRE